MSEVIKLLIIEDFFPDAELLVKELKNSQLFISACFVTNREDYLKQLSRFKPDIILSELMLAAFDGSEALALALEHCPETPFIFVSGDFDEEIALRLLFKGATDYVHKEQLAKLSLVIKRAAAEIKEKKQRKLAELSLTIQDALTRILTESSSLAEASPELLYFLCESLGWEVGQLWYPDPSSNKLACRSSWSSEIFDASQFILSCQQLKFDRSDNILGTAWQNKEHLWISNLSRIKEENRLTGLPTGQLTSLLVYPVVSHGEVNALFTFYALAEKSFDEQVIKIFNSISPLIGNFIEKENLEKKFYRVQRLESIGTLTGGIAHDLNNVLTPIMIAINFLQQKTLDEHSCNIINNLEKNVKRGADIIKQLLMFARGSEGEHIVLQPRFLIKETENMIKDTFPKSIEFSSEIAADSWLVRGHETQLYQVILNLCVNARDAMPGGGKLILKSKNLLIDDNFIKMNPEAKAGPYIQISVADTGKGIPPEIFDKIFEPFFTTKLPGQGTGLGLPTVRGIVKSHGGFINVYSEPDKGTIFRVYLPAIRSLEQQKTGNEKFGLPAGNGELILVVEDEAAIRDITCETLEAYGYSVITAEDGAEAISAYVLHQKKVHAVLLDMTMPFMDGAATSNALQKINPELKIITMSGLETNLKKNGNEGFFLQKPYTAEELLLVMDRCLSSNSGSYHISR